MRSPGRRRRDAAREVAERPRRGRGRLAADRPVADARNAAASVVADLGEIAGAIVDRLQPPACAAAGIADELPRDRVWPADANDRAGAAGRITAVPSEADC